MPTFYQFNNRDKGRIYTQTLLDAGYTIQNDFGADLLLIDYERGVLRTEIPTFIKKKPVFIYPHAAIADVLWDGICAPLRVTCNFVPGEGQKQVMTVYGYASRVMACGWPYSEVRRFDPNPGKKLLFAPIHPNARERLRDEDKLANKRAMRIILDNRHQFSEITLRFGSTLRGNGLDEFRNADIKYENAVYHMRSSIESIERADIVVSHGTFAYLAVALGKPTIFYEQEPPPHNINRVVKSYAKYKQIRWYPLELFATKDPGALFRRVCCEEPAVEEWKTRFIGGPFDKVKFLSTIEEYL